jgi:hypothetical protein
MADDRIPKDQAKVAAGKKGGKARAEALSDEERKEIASNAAIARWSGGGAVLAATHAGTLTIAGKEMPCAVLEDGTRLFTQKGVFRAIGRTGQSSGSSAEGTGLSLPVFLQARNLKPFISQELVRASAPIKFYPLRLDNSKSSNLVAMGFMASILPLVCKVFVDADNAGVLSNRQVHIAEQCRILHDALANVGIISLVDEATGFQAIRPKDALQEYLKLILRESLAAWAKKFPDEFYENIYKLKRWPWPGMSKNRFSVVAHYTRDLVYERLAPGLLQELEKRSPIDEETGERENKLHQWLNEEIGDPMLAQHLYSLMMFQRLALANGYGWNRFLRMVDKVHPKKGSTLFLPFADDLA